jgi:predicted metallopeptidase
MSPKKFPGQEYTSGKILKELSKKGITYLTQIYNAVLRTAYFPQTWKVAQTILIPKPGKPTEDLLSYRPISLLPIMSKVFEKLLLDRLLPIITERCLIPNHQFGFRQHHSTIEQIHRVTQVY